MTTDRSLPLKGDSPLLATDLFPAFHLIQADDVRKSMPALLRWAYQALEKVKKNRPDNWHDLSLLLEVPLERLSVAWNAVSHLQAVNDSPELRQAYLSVLPEISQFWSLLASDADLYAIYDHLEEASLNAEQQRVKALTLRQFKLSGCELPQEAKKAFLEKQERLSLLEQKFTENVLDATQAFEYLVDREALTGVSLDVLDITEKKAKDKQLEGHLLTLDHALYAAVMQTASQRALREHLYRAYVTRASEKEPPYDNTPIIEEIVQLRAQQAHLLGFAHYADWSLATKMAPNSAAVLDFLYQLVDRVSPQAQSDIQAMRDFAKQHLDIADPQAWDWAYISEKLKQHLFGFDEQALRPYFQAPLVLKGLFSVACDVFGLVFCAQPLKAWAEGVELFSVAYQEAPEKIIGYFFLDTLSRKGKRSGAWMSDVRSRWARPDQTGLQPPIAHMVCNFLPAAPDQPALLSHDDVITLFHEFGHVLHHLLSAVNEKDIAGINGVEWDAVELPSQLMENFAWEWEVLSRISQHVETKAPIDRALFECMQKAKHFQSSLSILKQVEYALFDWLIHQEAQTSALALIEQVRKKVGGLPCPSWNRMPHAFSHIFSGGYSAGYYSYLWAEVLSADAYDVFQTANSASVLDRVIGRRWIDEVLSRGGSRPAMESFQAFRDRAPDLNAFLKQKGLIYSAGH